MAAPIRTCMICGRKTTKDKLQRFVWRSDGPQADKSGSVPGRGAYCCLAGTCLQKSEKLDKKWKRIFRL